VKSEFKSPTSKSGLLQLLYFCHRTSIKKGAKPQFMGKH